MTTTKNLQARRNFKTDFQHVLDEIAWADAAAITCRKRGDEYSATTYELRALDLREQWDVRS